MTNRIRESDWKAFRKLHEAALDRYCGKVLAEVEELVQDGSRGKHERYRAVFRLLGERDKELAEAFDDPRRSRMLWQLAAIYHLGVIEPEEMEQFSAETRHAIELLSGEIRR